MSHSGANHSYISFMSWKDKIRGVIICQECGKADARRAVLHKFCKECSLERQRKRGNAWTKIHGRPPLSKSWERQRKRKREEFIQKQGEMVSVREAKGAKLLPDRTSSAKTIRIEFPFSGLLSKNALPNIGFRTGKPFIFITEEIHQFRDSISLMVKEQLGLSKWPTSKTWIDIAVQKPNNRLDAINIVDTLCDGLKVGLDLDDKWFAIGVLDWELVFVDPKVFVQISTTAVGEQKNCSICGQIKYLEEGFRKHMQTRDGFSGICKACTTALSRSKNKNMNGSIPNPIPRQPPPVGMETRRGWYWCGEHENCEAGPNGKHNRMDCLSCQEHDHCSVEVSFSGGKDIHKVDARGPSPSGDGGIAPLLLSFLP
jgi:hypothetical protein